MTASVSTSQASDRARPDEQSYFTVYAGGEIFGLPVENTQTIFRIGTITPVPHSPDDIIGLVNLRGRIVTAVSLRRRLKMAPEETVENALAIGIENRSETFGLIVDDVGDVISLSGSSEVAMPAHFSSQRARITNGLYRAGDLLLPVLNMDELFSFQH